MPRTFKATVVLILTLILLVIVTIVNLFQSNATQETVIALEQKLRGIEKTNGEIVQKLDSGVAVAAGSYGSGGGSVTNDAYADALNDPDNLLKAPTDLKVPPEAKFGGTLNRILSDTPKGFNWVTENSADVADLQFLINDSLARRDFNDPDHLVPQLAYKVTANEDKTEYTIHLRKGVMWHTPQVDFSKPENAWMKEPHEVTAEDFAFTLGLFQNPQVEAGAVKSYYQDMKSVEVIDPYTFKVSWAEPRYDTLELSVSVSAMPKWLFTVDETGKPLDEATLGLKFNNHWASKYAVGNGAYLFKEMKAGEHIILERNPLYYGTKFPIERLEFSIVKDPDAAFIKLKAGEVDFSGIPQTRYKSEIIDPPADSPFTTGKLKYRLVDSFGYRYIGWNADKPLFADKRVRWAMTYAMNRQALVDQVFNGLGALQTGPYYYKHPGNKPSIKPVPFDLEKAKQMLDEAGWIDSDNDGIREKTIDGHTVKFAFTILSYDSPVYRSALAVYKEDLRKIGVQMDPTVLDWPTLQKRMDEKKFDAFVGGWGLSWSVDPYQLWHSSQADIPKGSNYVGFRNKDADTIIETLRVTFDQDKRLKLMHDFHQLIYDEQPYTFWMAPKSAIAWNPRVKNVITNSTRPQFTSLPWYLDDSAVAK